MKNAYRIFKRNKGYYYLQNNETGVQKSLATKDPYEAEKLLNVANDERQAPDLNLSLGKTYLTHADPSATKRVWQNVIDELCSHGKESTRVRYQREFRSTAYDLIRQKSLIQTTSDDFRLVMKRGTQSTNRALRILHNCALGNGWIHWQIIMAKQWPDFTTKPKRAVTHEEYQKIPGQKGLIPAELRRDSRKRLLDIRAKQFITHIPIQFFTNVATKIEFDLQQMTSQVQSLIHRVENLEKQVSSKRKKSVKRKNIRRKRG